MSPPRTAPANSSARLLRAGAAVVLVAACARAGAADDEPSVTPYRPTVSNPAALSAPGWLEGEFGALRALGEDRSRNDSVPWLLKYAFDDNHGLLIGGNAWVRNTPFDAPGRSGLGDSFLEWKQRFPVGDKSAFGIEAGVSAPTAHEDLGAGSAQWIVNGIYSADAGPLHFDLNAGAVRGGDRPAKASAWQATWASAVSTAIGDRFGAAFELSGTRQRGVPTRNQALVAVNYNVSKRLSLDAGVARGLARDAHDRNLFAGATVLIGELRR